MVSPPTPQVRLTISVTPEVHAVFTRLSKASGRSISRAMAEWLDDTLDAAEYMTQKVEEARTAPRKVAQQLHAYALGAAEMTGQFLEEVREKGRADRAERATSGRPGPLSPPSSNTGGKGTGNGKGKPLSGPKK